MCKVPIVLCCPVTLGLIEFRWGNLNSTIKLLSPTVCQCVPVCQCVSVSVCVSMFKLSLSGV